MRALREERHFALVEGLRLSNLGSLVIVFRSGTQSDPCISSVATAIMITTSNSSSPRSVIPNQLLGVRQHTIAMSGLSRVSTWADGPRNLMKITWSRVQNRTGWSGEIEFAMEKLRPSACLIRSVRG